MEPYLKLVGGSQDCIFLELSISFVERIIKEYFGDGAVFETCWREPGCIFLELSISFVERIIKEYFVPDIIKLFGIHSNEGLQCPKLP